MQKLRWPHYLAGQHYSKRLGHPLIVLLLAAVLILFYVGAVTREVSAIQQSVIAQSSMRKMLLDEDMQQHIRFATLMSHIISRQYELAHTACEPHPALQKLHNYPDINTYGLSGFIEEGEDANLAGSLSGIGNLAQINSITHCEMTAVLTIDGAMKNLGIDDKRITSAYYTSKRGFAYVAPKLRLSQYHMKADDYYHDLWTLAAPQKNPERKAIMTSLYEDGFGKGLMITVSNPVWFENEFLGVFSFDMTTKTLANFLTLGKAIGTSVIVDKNNFLVTPTTQLSPKQTLEIDSRTLPNQLLIKVNGNWWYRDSIWPDELYLLHKFSVHETYWQAIIGTTDILLTLLAFILLYSLLLKSLSAQEQMLELSRKDSLTHIYNRRGFIESSNAIINTTKRNHKYWGIMIFDIDHFKSVNDTFGHDTGDAVIKNLAQFVEKNIRIGDVLGRWGGEEFVVLLYGGDLSGSTLLAERLRTSVEKNILLPNNTPVTISIGLASGGSDLSLQQAINNADKCLYNAKETGRNKLCTEGSE